MDGGEKTRDKRLVWCMRLLGISKHSISVVVCSVADQMFQSEAYPHAELLLYHL